MWVKGTIELNCVVYDYQAKVYAEGSQFGINNGRISKLQVRQGDNILINYDRGWDIEPDKSDKDLMKVYQQILDKYA